MKIKIKDLEEKAKNAFKKENLADKVSSCKIHTTPEVLQNIKNELPKEDLEEVAYFDEDGRKVRVFAETGMIDDMRRNSPCDLRQDSIKDSMDSKPKPTPFVGGYNPDDVRESREAVNKENPASGIDGVRESRINIAKENFKNVPTKIYENSRKMAEEINKHRNECKSSAGSEIEDIHDIYQAKTALDNATKAIVGVDDIPEDLSNFYTKKNRPAMAWDNTCPPEASEPIAKEPIATESDELPKYEFVNHPKHYNNYDMEVIDMMTRLFGVHETISFCKLNAFKYRMRAGTKPGESAEQDIRKEQWYLDKAKELEGHLS